MLSVLIPTYNYNIYPLVEAIHGQALKTGVPFEIICLDDASADKAIQAENQRINSFTNSSYEILQHNIGRSAIRNLLAKKAQYKWLLFLDADTMPIGESFISGYLPYLNKDEKVVYGGIVYQKETPPQNEILRWVYGNEREALTVEKRQKNQHLSFLTLNFCIHKNIFNRVSFNEDIPNLRHEDTLFSYNLQQAEVTVEHINNPVQHNGLESSETFLRKSEESVIGLKYLLDNSLLSEDYIRISKTYKRLKRSGLIYPARIWHWLTKAFFRKNLLGSKPSLFIFDLYRLGYLCSIK